MGRNKYIEKEIYPILGQAKPSQSDYYVLEAIFVL